MRVCVPELCKNKQVDSLLAAQKLANYSTRRGAGIIAAKNNLKAAARNILMFVSHHTR